MKNQMMLLVLVSTFSKSLAIWCYQCTGATPGCSEPFNWRGIGYLGQPCLDNDDICVKLIERKGAQKVITRDCLSNFKAFRSDIPADTYEGCRPAAKDVNLANYVNNTIKELDVKRPSANNPLIGVIKIQRTINMDKQDLTRARDNPNDCIFSECSSEDLVAIPDNMKINLLLAHNFYIPPSCKVCAQHLQERDWGELVQYPDNARDFNQEWYDETTWCFCFLDHRCNGASVTSVSMALPILFSAILLLAGVQLFDIHS